MKLPSLYQRLGLGLGGLLLVLLLLQAGITFWTLSDGTESYVRERLGHDQESLLAALEIHQGLPLLPSGGINPSFTRPFSGHYYQLHFGVLTLYSRSLWNAELPHPPLSPGEKQFSWVTGPHNQPLLVLSAGYTKGNLPLVLSVAEDISTMQAARNRWLQFQALLALLAVLGLGTVLHILLRQGLHPLTGVVDDLERLERGTIDRLGEQVPVEVAPLVQAFNRTLEQLQQRLARSRNALGDLSHTLKRPLTRMGQLLEKHPWPEMEQETATMRQHIDRHLKRGRLAGAAPGTGIVDLAASAQAVWQVLRPVYSDRGLAFSLEGKAQVRLDREDALELLGNLLENACKWGHSKVRVTLKQSETQVILTIEDDGPGCPEAQLATLVQRGVRADESVPGHGLGLPLVQEIVASYKGTLTLSSSERLKGFQAQVTLPSSPLV